MVGHFREVELFCVKMQCRTQTVQPFAAFVSRTFLLGFGFFGKTSEIQVFLIIRIFSFCVGVDFMNSAAARNVLFLDGTCSFFSATMQSDVVRSRRVPLSVKDVRSFFVADADHKETAVFKRCPLSSINTPGEISTCE